MASSQTDIEAIIARLAFDANPLKIQANGPDAIVYRVQKTFLAGVSTKLAEYCCQQPAKLDISQEVLHIFLAWLISRVLNGVTLSQESLAEAWNFGAQYDISDFQDAVMHCLVPCLYEDHVDPDAVIEAYVVDERGTKLQRAFIAQLAIDMRRRDEFAWDRTIFTDNCLEDVQGFLLDLTDAMADDKVKLVTSDYLLKPQDDTK